MFDKIIKELCHELDIKYTYLSKDWVIMLTKEDKVRYLVGNKFDLNGHGIGSVMDDKYAFYDTLKKMNLPICEYNIFYRENNYNDYAQGCHREEDLINIFNKYQGDVIVKPNLGSIGLGVYHITDKKELLTKTKELLNENFSISICPFYHIKNEYRVIVLDNESKLIFKKINPTVTGDGKSTLKELLIKFNPYYFKDKEIINYIPKKDEIYTYDFRFNLSCGSIASLDITDDLKEKLAVLALDASKRVGITFASIDIIETTNHELLIMEANSGVTINKVINFIPNGYEIAKNIYREAILKMISD